MNVEATLLELERQFWQADPRFHDSHYADDIVTIVDGRIIGRVEALASVAEVPALVDLDIADAHIRRLTDETVAVAYRATARRRGRSAPYMAVIGSVYVRRQGRWRLAFHQHTPVAASAAAIG